MGDEQAYGETSGGDRGKCQHENKTERSRDLRGTNVWLVGAQGNKKFRTALSA